MEAKFKQDENLDSQPKPMYLNFNLIDYLDSLREVLKQHGDLTKGKLTNNILLACFSIDMSEKKLTNWTDIIALAFYGALQTGATSEEIVKSLIFISPNGDQE